MKRSEPHRGRVCTGSVSTNAHFGNPVCLCEPLEGRTLLSVTWGTDYGNTDAKITIEGLAADSAGDVYASGRASPNQTPVVRERTPDWTWTTIATLPLDDTGGTAGLLSSVAFDSRGNLFVIGQAIGTDGASYARIFEQPSGQPGTFRIVDNLRTLAGGPYGLAADAAGDVYATETAYITTKPNQASFAGEIRKLTPNPASSTGFSASTLYVNTSVRFSFPSSLAVVNSGPSAGIYAVGSDISTGKWNVLKSADGGATWSAVDQFQYDPNTGSKDATAGPTNGAHAVFADSAGNVYVGGYGDKAVITGYAKNRTPIYSDVPHWIVRESTTGGAGSWNTVLDYLQSGAQSASASAIGEDLAGNTYVAGTMSDSTGQKHGVIFSNEGGSWSQSDDHTDAYLAGGYTCFACDTSGNLYASGNTSIVRTAAGPAPSSTVNSAFSSTLITTSSSTSSDSTSWLKTPEDPLLS